MSEERDGRPEGAAEVLPPAGTADAAAPASPRQGILVRRRALVVTAFLMLALASVGYAWDWYRSRTMEAEVSRYITDAENCYSHGAVREARTTYFALIKRFPHSRQMSRVFFNLGDMYLETFGNLSAARDFYQTQIRNYPFSFVTFDSMKRLDYVNRMSDLGTSYAELPYREFVMARRMIWGPEQPQRIARLKRILDDYPQSAVVPEALLLLGEIHLERFDRPSEAKVYYSMLRARFPESDYLARIPPESELNRPDGSRPQEPGKVS